jgi:hypothetical protein
VNWSRERYLTWAGDSDRVVQEYSREERRELALLYRRLTGAASRRVWKNWRTRISGEPIWRRGLRHIGAGEKWHGTN